MRSIGTTFPATCPRPRTFRRQNRRELCLMLARRWIWKDSRNRYARTTIGTIANTGEGIGTCVPLLHGHNGGAAVDKADEEVRFLALIPLLLGPWEVEYHEPFNASAGCNH